MKLFTLCQKWMNYLTIKPLAIINIPAIVTKQHCIALSLMKFKVENTKTLFFLFQRGAYFFNGGNRNIGYISSLFVI
jgi:hypothetical protein